MTYKHRYLFFCSFTLITVLLCGCPQEKNLVGGYAGIAGFSLDEAAIHFSSLADEQSVWETEASEGRFTAFEAPLNTGMDYLVETDGGHIGETPFDGVLKAYVEGFEPGQFIHINILTTILAEYTLKTGLPLNESKAKLKTLFGIESAEDMETLVYRFNTAKDFCLTRFREKAQQNGGLNAYIDKIVDFLIEREEPLDFGNLSPTSVDPDEHLGLQQASSEKSAIASAVIKGVFSVGTSVFKKITKPDYEQMLLDIQDDLDDIQIDLDEIKLTLENIQDSMNDLFNALSLAQGQIQLGTIGQELDQMDGLVATEWNKYMAIVEDAAELSINDTEGWETIRTQIKNFATRLRLASYMGTTGIDNLLIQYNVCVTDSLDGATVGYIKTYADILSKKTVDDSRSSFFDTYLTLEQVYSRIILRVRQIMQLQIEMMGYFANDDNSANDPVETVEEFEQRALKEYIAPQMEDFLQAVDMLVTRYLDTRHFLPRGQNALPLPKEVKDAYARADFLAAYMAPGIFGNAVLRLVGPPKAVRYWSYANVTLNGVRLFPDYSTEICYNDMLTRDQTEKKPLYLPKDFYFGAYKTGSNNGRTLAYVDVERSVACIRLAVSAESVGSAGRQYTGILPLEGGNPLSFKMTLQNCYQDATLLADTAPTFGTAASGEEAILFGSAFLSAFDTYGLLPPTEQRTDYDYKKKWHTPIFGGSPTTMDCAIQINGNGGSGQYQWLDAQQTLLGTQFVFENNSQNYAEAKVSYTGKMYLHKNNSDPRYIFQLNDRLENYVEEDKNDTKTFSATKDLTISSSMDFSPELFLHSYNSGLITIRDKVHTDVTATVTSLTLSPKE